MIAWIVMIGLFLGTLVISLGIAEHLTNIAAHKLIGEHPHRWLSAEEVLRRRRRMRDIVVPGALALVAALTGNVATALLVDAFQQDSTSRANAGLVWLMCTFVTLIALVISASLTEKSEWDLVGTREALLLWIQSAQTRGEAIRAGDVEARVAVIRKPARADTKACAAHARFPVATDQLSSRVEILRGSIRLSSGSRSAAPTWGNLLGWLWRFGRFPLILAALQAVVMIALVSTLFNGSLVQRIDQVIVVGSLIWQAFGLVILSFSLRSGMLYWSRSWANDRSLDLKIDEKLSNLLGEADSSSSRAPFSLKLGRLGAIDLRLASRKRDHA